MAGSDEIVRWLAMGAALLFACTGAGLYLRGFWVYFRAVAWLRKPEQVELRRRYRSSALAAMFSEPGLGEAKRQILMAFVGVVVFVGGGVVFNSLRG